MSAAGPKTFVMGWPIAHSRSPLIHGYWLKHYRIDGTYERLAVSPEQFADIFPALGERGFAGGNITLPHKISALAFIDEADILARTIGAVNTVRIENGRYFGTNTDAYGFYHNLITCAPHWRADAAPALVLGAGGACLAIVASLLKAQVPRIYLANRTKAAAEQLQDKFGPKIKVIDWDKRTQPLADCGLLVNTTSLGMTGKPALMMDISNLPAGALVTDLVYAPLETQLLKAARLQGLSTADGLGMLLHQAAPGFEQWFGLKPEVTTELRQIVEADLKANP